MPLKGTARSARPQVAHPYPVWREPCGARERVQAPCAEEREDAELRHEPLEAPAVTRPRSPRRARSRELSPYGASRKGMFLVC